MKKGDKVEINNNTKKQIMRNSGFNWSENTLGETIVKESTILYHVSAYEKLTSFAPVETCFDTGSPALTSVGSHVYVVKINKDVKATTVEGGPTEVRIDLGKYANSIEIYYAGTIEGTEIEKYKINTNIFEGSPVRYNFHKNFKGLENKLNNEELESFYANVKPYQEVRIVK